MKIRNYYAHLLVLAAAFFFATFEFLTSFVLFRVSIDVYLLSRLIVGIPCALIIWWAVEKNGFQLTKIYSLLFHKKLDLLLFRTFLWCFTIVGLSVSFRYSSSQAVSYVFFLMHPIWAYLFQWMFNKYKPNYSIFTFVSFGLMILGGIIFAFGGDNKNNEINYSIPSQYVYVIGLIAGAFFAASNMITAQITKIDDPASHQISAAEVSIFTYIIGFLSIPIIILWLHNLSLPVLEVLNFTDDFTNHTLRIINIESQKLTNTGVFSFLILIGVLAALANQLFVSGMKNATEGSEASVSSMELASIPMVIFLEWLLVMPMREVTFMSFIGLVLIILGSIVSIVFSE